MTLDYLPDSFVYPDIEPALLAREEGEMREAAGAWARFMRRVLRPVPMAGSDHGSGAEG